MKVSVIIPLYNQIKYLNRCMESVLMQTYRDLEIIVVDDGSTDGSEKECDKWKARDGRVIVVHKENGGLSTARNVGLGYATGEFVFYLDSDDYISKNCIEKLLKVHEKTGSQITITRMRYISENCNEEIETNEQENTLIFTSQEAIEQSLYQKLFSCNAPAKLYEKTIADSVQFPIGKLSEDLATCHYFLNKAEKVAFTNYAGYYYRQQSESIMHTFTPKRVEALEWAIEIEKFCETNYPEIINAAYCRTFNVAIHLLLDLPDDGRIHDEFYKRIWSEIKRTRLKIITDKKARNREKIAAILSFGGEKLLKKSWRSKMSIRKGGI